MMAHPSVLPSADSCELCVPVIGGEPPVQGPCDGKFFSHSVCSPMSGFRFEGSASCVTGVWMVAGANLGFISGEGIAQGSFSSQSDGCGLRRTQISNFTHVPINAPSTQVPVVTGGEGLSALALADWHLDLPFPPQGGSWVWGSCHTELPN